MIKDLLKSRFSKDLIITVVGQGLLMILALVINKINSINLGATDYSIFNVAKKSVGIISGIMAVSLGIALPRYIAMKQNYDKKARYLIGSLMIMIIASLVVCLVMFILRNWFGVVIFGDAGFENLIMPMVLYSFSVAFSTIIYSYYRGCNAYYKYNISQMIVNIAMLIIAIFVRKSIKWILLLWGISIIVISIIFLLLILKSLREELGNLRMPTKELRELSLFGLPRIIGEIALFSFTTVPLIIIAHREGIDNNYLISTAINISGMIFPVFSFAGVILLPYVSNAVSDNDIKRIDKPIFVMGLLYIVFSLFVIAFIDLFPKFVISLLFSEEFLPSVRTTTILIWSILPASLYYLLRNPIDGLSRIPFNTINLAISFGILCGLVVYFNDYDGYALAFIIGYSILCLLSIISFLYCRRRIMRKCCDSSEL